ncbi:GGDEF domain-containing protein [Aliarcobacter trophiarum LMG 25534]|uniref:Diguanylate cyclase n=1 Tax=Aliarcobacter trophiarum LMG 25534 TaxID=1032241 RepID=A0AAD0QIW5_9BACT|nr:GGDEF domain-containing protein [Aliarcobacter trophiarum]AXK48834.1 diguanylate cyclase [Aliarcobacter trophiarum LMG 25534]RXJ92571.1 GGDEF domain-containing protein [Aliarcobacter trophiarum LMG 25534]
MSNFYETITELSLKLSTSEKTEIFDDIFEFLELNFNVAFLKVFLRKNGISSSVFDNSNEANSQFFYTYKTKLTNSLELTFGLIFENQKKLDSFKKDTTNINIALDILSMNIYTKHLENTISDILIIDLLTGCYNRTYLNHYIRSIFSLASREGKKIAFLKVGVDHFKAVLDEFNYEIGDRVIKRLATVLQNGVRDSDLVIRVSNDAFLVLLQNIQEEENAILVANKLIDNFKKEKIVVNHDTNQILMKTICVGITFYPKDGTNLDTIIKKSDIAIREAKNRGRSMAFVFSEDETSKIELF